MEASRNAPAGLFPRGSSSGSRVISPPQVVEVRTSRQAPLAVTYHPDRLIKDHLRLLRSVALQHRQRLKTEGGVFWELRDESDSCISTAS